MNGHTFTHPSDREWLDVEEIATVPAASYRAGAVHVQLTNGRPCVLSSREWDRVREFGCIERPVGV